MARALPLLAAVALGSALSGCSSAGGQEAKPAAPAAPTPTAAGAGTAQGEKVTLREPCGGPSGKLLGVEERGHWAFTDRVAWKSFWEKGKRALGEEPGEAPAFDPAKEVLVVFASGQKPTAGFRVQAVSARVEGGAVVVLGRETGPKKDAILAQVVTHPVHVVAVPLPAGAGSVALGWEK